MVLPIAGLGRRARRRCCLTTLLVVTMQATSTFRISTRAGPGEGRALGLARGGRARRAGDDARQVVHERGLGKRKNSTKFRWSQQIQNVHQAYGIPGKVQSQRRQRPHATQRRSQTPRLSASAPTPRRPGCPAARSHLAGQTAARCLQSPRGFFSMSSSPSLSTTSRAPDACANLT